MSSTGYEKWEKYFKDKKVDTVLNCPGEVRVYDVNNNVIDLIPGHFAITVQKTTVYNTKYPIKYTIGTEKRKGYVSQSYIKKPLWDGPTEHLQIKSKDLITLGKLDTIKYGKDEINVRVFSNNEFLSESIKIGLIDNEFVNIDIINTFNGYLAANTYNQIVWENKVTTQEKNELGKYVGELIPGLMMFSNTGPFTSDSFCKDAIGFAVPIDPSHAGIDSFIIFDSEEYIGISTKYGRGALASFFNNIIPLVQVYGLPYSKSVFRDIYEHYNRLSDKTYRSLVYNYGIRNILGIPTAILPDHNTLYKEISEGNISKISHICIMRIKEKCQDKNIIDNLPNSVTSFFCREIAKRLNTCEESKTEILKLMSKKTMYQVNLNTHLWCNGTIDYSITHAGATNIKFSGAKSPISNLQAKWGLINYQIVK